MGEEEECLILVATPKQIRELMQVDSLTNDEVKSHLQFGESSKGSSSQSGSPQGPLQLATNTGGTSTIACESMEDDEDAKFECYSWKSHVQKPRKNNV
ncbi:hypothetical protein GOBAR_DD35850 [Gossypium barbadense]|nr:hypothetical protein GOBAR_DD35850 [Gossypium barbadense]